MCNIPIYISYQGMLLTGQAYPVQAMEENTTSSLQIFIQGFCLGILSYTNEKWAMDKPIDPEFITALGNYIHAFAKKNCCKCKYAGSLIPSGGVYFNLIWIFFKWKYF